ncbi:MAG: TolC family protein [Kiritimatiellae bacterium]|nr:TolC family protein [Kiritimatiellia bacterium]
MKRRWMMKWLLPLGMLCWGVVISRGQSIEAEPVELDLPRIIQFALDNNLDILYAREERRVADGLVTEATAGALPHFAVNGSYTRLDSMPEVRGDVDNYSAKLGVVQPLYVGGRVSAARRIANEFNRSVSDGINRTEQDIIFTVQRVFYEVLLAREDLAVANDAAVLAQENLAEVKTKFEQGTARRFDLLRAEEQHSQSWADQLRASNAVALARTALFTLIRISPDSSIPLVGELSFTPGEVDEAQALETALECRPDLRQSASRLKMQEDAIVIAGAGMRPTLSARADAGYINPDRAAVAEWSDCWSATVALEIPVFDGLDARGKVAQERARLEQYRYQDEALRDAIQKEITQAVLNYRTAQQRVTAWQTSMAQSEESYRLVTVGYREGINPQIDVLSSQLSLTNTRRAYYRAVYEHVMADLSLKKAEGLIYNETIGEENL